MRMPLVFTKDEIKQQLFQLGFEPTDEELKYFIRDLKHLIKAEQRLRHERNPAANTGGNENQPPPRPPNPTSTAGSPSSIEFVSTFDTTNTDTTTPQTTTIDVEEINVPPRRPPRRDPSRPSPSSTLAPGDTRKVLRDRINNRKTLSENGSIMAQKAVTNRKSIGGNITKQESSRVPLDSGGGGGADVVDSSKSKTPPTTTSSTSSSCVTYSSSFEIYLDSSTDFESDDGSCTKRRVRLPPKSVRHDPVSLYHFYKSIWDKQKVPGENPRMQLRWNVRAGTLGKIPCDPEGNPIKYLR